MEVYGRQYPNEKPWPFLRSIGSAPRRRNPLYHHSPQEVYIIRQGEGVLLSSSNAKRIYKDSFVYIPQNIEHGLRNTGKEELELLWIFPTDCWEEVEYVFEK
tara:strand:- start:33 stop:338 length:306 start_codon:yes stop_codon:yes gene_type:complete